jgi:hypothetical protein
MSCWDIAFPSVREPTPYLWQRREPQKSSERDATKLRKLRRLLIFSRSPLRALRRFEGQALLASLTEPAAGLGLSVTILHAALQYACVIPSSVCNPVQSSISETGSVLVHSQIRPRIGVRCEYKGWHYPATKGPLSHERPFFKSPSPARTATHKSPRNTSPSLSIQHSPPLPSKRRPRSTFAVLWHSIL